MYIFIIPGGMEQFQSFQGEKNTNFSLNSGDELQFYPNLRYSDSTISYRIENCPLQKQQEFTNSLSILENKTILKFYSVSGNEEIYLTCDSKTRVDGEFFVAGEGGPTEIVKTSNFNVILHGKVLLLRESKCEKPIVGIHELLHALGFAHSPNKNNIMYNFSNCNQEIGEDLIKRINTLYSVESLPDLSIEEASAEMSKIYLNAKITFRNNGLKNVGESNLDIFVDGKNVKQIPISELKIGSGSTLTISNIFVPDLNVQEVKFEIVYPDRELNKTNNEVVLKMKK
jgi:hypothetical protein